MSRPRYSIFVGRKYSTGDKESHPGYYFKDHKECVKEYAAQTGVHYGVQLLYRDGDFVSMKDPHDAIIFCRALNIAEEESQAK